MKIIFLDFDGVLNSFSKSTEIDPNSEKLLRCPTCNKERFWEAQELDPDLVLLLNKIIRNTGAKVVISSSWRWCRTKEELAEILEYRKFKGEVIDLTPDFSCTGKNRADEIQQWLDDCTEEVESFVILDDGYKDIFRERFGDNFILMELSEGLKKKHVKKAIQILGRVN